MKFCPLSGQGGNNAVEGAATFAGLLHETVNNSSYLFQNTPLNKHQISSIFEQIQTLRLERMRSLVAASHTQQRLVAWDTKFLKRIDLWYVPRVPLHVIFDETSAPLIGGQRCSALPVPKRTHDLLAYDELICQPKDRKDRTNVVIFSSFVMLLATTVYSMKIAKEKTPRMHLSEYREASFSTFSLPEWNLDFWWQLNHLFLEFVVLATWTVESLRSRNQRNTTGW